MRKVPDHKRPSRMNQFSDRRHVMHPPGLIVDMCEANAGDLIAVVATQHRSEVVGSDRGETVAVRKQTHHSLDNVKISWEVVLLRDDYRAP